MSSPGAEETLHVKNSLPFKAPTMADDDDAIAETSEMELEFKRRADASWHPCQLSLCPGGGINVKFEGQASEDKILDTKDALADLRVRSLPLQGDDCCHIEEGKHVLAACENNSERLFFDAIVEKVIRVRHSKRASCRCSFMIKWLFEHAEKGISCIPSSSIMKLATESINAHPVVAAFLNSMERSCLSSSSSSFTDFDDTETEIDLQGLLKQIEGIGSLTDASNEELLKDKVHHGGKEGWTKLFAFEQLSKCVEVSRGKSSLRRSTGRQNMPQSTIEDSITSAPSSLEKSVQSQSPLSPLASRAVLASLVSNLPQKVSVLDFSPSLRSPGGNCTLTVNKVESLVTNDREYSGQKLHAQKSNGSIMEVCNKIEPSIDSGGTLSFSLGDEEPTLPVVTSRQTRSAIKKESSNTNLDDHSTSVEDAIFVRVTRSAAHGGKKNMADKSCEELQSKKLRLTRATSSAPKKDSVGPYVDNKSKILDEAAKCSILSSTTRVTRSAAHAGTGLLDDRAKESLKAKTETESAHSSGCEAMISTKKRTFSLINAELKLAEKDKKQTDMNVVNRTQKATVEDLHVNGDSQTRKKPISSKNQPSRFSPRLRSSFRTRSHDKS